jgi:hypothetical protein
MVVSSCSLGQDGAEKTRQAKPITLADGLTRHSLNCLLRVEHRSGAIQLSVFDPLEYFAIALLHFGGMVHLFIPVLHYGLVVDNVLDIDSMLILALGFGFVTAGADLLETSDVFTITWPLTCSTV